MIKIQRKTKTAAFIILLALPFTASAQIKDTIKTSELDEVVVRAYEQGKQLLRSPVAVNYVGTAALERFSPASYVMAVNTTPGIRMEERSPGSYRINIRGSSLRSPFGVRNVKIYFNDLPFTDPGGHSYLNQLGFYDVRSMEIIKGPGSSLYGSGTGGVLLIESLKPAEQPAATLEFASGSYNFNSVYAAVTTVGDRYTHRFGFHHQQSDGYRRHSQMKKQVFSWNGRFNVGEQNQLKTTFLFGDLFYQTPGALTLDEFNADPRSSRPGNAFSPGAVDNRAAIYQKSFIVGASYLHHLAPQLQNRTSVYGMFTQVKNPAIRNFGKYSEPHTGIRTIFQYNKPFSAGNLSFDLGAEWQYGFPKIDVHQNNAGTEAALLTHDDMDIRQQFLFGQISAQLNNWTLTAGGSLNSQDIKLKRFHPAPDPLFTKEFTNEFAPRISLSRQFNNILIYSGIARGFSPASTTELAPSGSALNPGLEPEYGLNYEIGTKGKFANGFYFDINAFYFDLDNTIVQRRDAAGGEFFINSGRAVQKGIETAAGIPMSFLNLPSSLFWISHTWHHFEYDDFKQVNDDFSGNTMPGNPRHTLAAGADLKPLSFLFANLHYYYSGKIPLNDANSAYSAPAHLLGFRAGIEMAFLRKLGMKFTVGAENLLDENYSLGFDINGFGGRYYNAAPGRNFYTSLLLNWRYR